MKNLFASICVLFATILVAQNFKPGYYVDNTGNKVKCLIDKNLTYYSLDRFAFKLDEKGTIEYKTVNDVSEVGLDNTNVYYRFTVDIDLSSERITELTTYKKNDYQSKTVLLELLEKGKISLYMYKTENILRFFYLKEGESIPQMLDYKKYLSGQESNIISVNEDYKQELFNLLSNGGITTNDLVNLDYDEKGIAKVIHNYNSYFNSVIDLNTKDRDKANKTKIYLKPIFGLGFSSINFERNTSNNIYAPLTFGSEANMFYGLEFEIEMFSNYSIFSSLTLHSFQSKEMQVISTFPVVQRESTVNYEGLNAKLGFRKYFQLNSKFDVFLEASGLFDFITNEGELQDVFPLMYNFNNTIGISAGGGMRLNKKLTVFANYDFKRNLTSEFQYTEFKISSINIGVMYDILGLFSKSK